MVEVLLINLVCDEIIDEDQLLIKMMVYMFCFCFEVGFYGCDICGLICMYQFDKVEMVQIVCLEDFMVVLEEMIGYVEKVFQLLGLLYCKIILCIGDMGFGVCKIYDFEVWVLVQNIYCEIFFCFNVWDFQVCCMQVCCCSKFDKKICLVYILNGFGLVVGCILVVVMENYQQVDGCIEVLEVLCLYMNGLEYIG